MPEVQQRSVSDLRTRRRATSTPRPPSRGDKSAGGARTSRSRKNAALPAPISNVQIMAPSAATIAEVTAENMIQEFEEARKLALDKGQASAAVTATMAKARLARLRKEKPENNPAPPRKFDGNYTEAARRIAFLLRLSEDEMSTGHKS